MPIHEIRHPLIRHKLGLMRRADISTKSFRELAQEVGALLTYEATKDLPLENYRIEGWCGPVEVEKIAGKKITVVPILRAGIGMLDGVLRLIPNAKVSVVGLSRDEETLVAHTYVEKLVGEIDQRLALIVDPMLATGGSMAATVDMLKKAGCKGNPRLGAGRRAGGHPLARTDPPRRDHLHRGHRPAAQRERLHHPRPGRCRRQGVRYQAEAELRLRACRGSRPNLDRP